MDEITTPLAKEVLNKLEYHNSNYVDGDYTRLALKVQALEVELARYKEIAKTIPYLDNLLDKL